MNKLVIYIHGRGGNADEAEHYRSLFPYHDIIGFDYSSRTPWQAEEEFTEFVSPLCEKYTSVILIANSIGAYFSLCSLGSSNINKAFFISPVVDMENLIINMMKYANITEEELKDKGEIKTSFGETLSYKYLCYAREYPPLWNIPTHILYGEKDDLTSYETISAFSKKTGAILTVMENGEHYFHTEEQMQFLDSWIKQSL
ncbi:MAG: alpha/beta hydrolase [Firmicutes bacterium]|nr:alpha/beta hydrolase [Bacillota bacterium]